MRTCLQFFKFVPKRSQAPETKTGVSIDRPFSLQCARTVVCFQNQSSLAREDPLQQTDLSHRLLRLLIRCAERHHTLCVFNNQGLFAEECGISSKSESAW